MFRYNSESIRNDGPHFEDAPTGVWFCEVCVTCLDRLPRPGVWLSEDVDLSATETPRG
jgi:hypothetical protein